MLLASPLKPSTILVGKLLSSLTYLVILILSSLPLMILCFLLGGILLSEIARAYLVLILAAGTFGLLSVACSSYFRRTSSALVVSYLVILPLAVACVVLTRTDNTVAARLRLDRRAAAVVPGDLDDNRIAGWSSAVRLRCKMLSAGMPPAHHYDHALSRRGLLRVSVTVDQDLSGALLASGGPYKTERRAIRPCPFL